MDRPLRLAALLLLAVSCRNAVERAVPQYPSAPVIIVSVESLRADRLPMFGYSRVATPHLDRFRADSILYTNAYTHAPLTLPAHASLLTGLLPYEHGVRDDTGHVLREGPTIQRSLKASGYATGAAVSSYALRGSTGLSIDFDEYDDAISWRAGLPGGEVQRPGSVTSEVAAKWIEARSAEEPFFYLLHLAEPHLPREPGAAFRARYRDRYDAEIATADAVIGAFFERLRQSGIYDRAIIILLSDHGESLGDHGEPGHGLLLYRASTHVPLLLKLPKGQRRGSTIETPAALVDIAPTVAALTGVSPLLPRHGRSLLDLPKQRRVYIESIHPRIHFRWRELRSLAGGQYQYIDAPVPELYDLFTDPRQRTNIIAERPEVARRMRDELAGYREAATPAAVATAGFPSPRERAATLRALARASELLRTRRWDAAVKAYGAVTDEHPGMPAAWRGLGDALQAAGRYEEAADAYGHLIDRSPELAGEGGLRRATVLLELEDFDAAEKSARLAEATNRGAMYAVLARIGVARGNLGAAEAHARAAANDPNHRLSGQLLLAQILAEQGRAAEALPMIERVGAEIDRLDLAPMESYELVRGEILGRLERYDEAIDAVRREIEHFPARRQSYARLYFLYTATGRESEADQALQQMVRAARESPAAMLLAARTADAVGDTLTAAAWRARAEPPPPGTPAQVTHALRTPASP